jgi:5-methylcytosine-specific restriction endonuclease McrA
MAGKRCGKCQRILPHEAFHPHWQNGLQWQCKDCDRFMRSERHRAWRKLEKRIANTEFEHLWSRDGYFHFMESRAWRCHYCKAAVWTFGGGYWVDKVNPRSGYDPDNCVPACYPCNRLKFDMHVELFRKLIRTLLEEHEPGKIPWDVYHPKFKRKRLREFEELDIQTRLRFPSKKPDERRERIAGQLE